MERSEYSVARKTHDRAGAIKLYYTKPPTKKSRSVPGHSHLPVEPKCTAPFVRFTRSC
jgi:hypothetical protein